MNFVLIGSSAINVNLIVEVKRISANNFTVFLSDQRVFVNLTRSTVDPILNIIRIGDLL